MKKALLIFILIACMIPISTFTVNAVLSQAVINLAGQCEVVKSGDIGEDITFTDADFRQALGLETYPDITILSLPDPQSGVLKLDTLRVSVGQVIPRISIEKLTFTPSSESVREATFTFRAGNLSGGAPLTCTIRFTDRENHAPSVGEGGVVSTFSTRKNASLWGTMACYDPDGDDLTYLVITYPKHGTLSVTDASVGAFRYTPAAGYSGRDSFSYVVRDSYGSYSSVAEVKITVDKRTQDISISDMSEDASAYAALRMVSANIMEAQYSGHAVYFHPSGTMTRAEFLVAAMKACGKNVITSASWQYDDLSAIPATSLPYVAEATASGYVTPTWQDGLYFRPNDTITCADAYEWLSAMCDGHLSGILLENGDAALTRGDAAWMLYAASTQS